MEELWKHIKNNYLRNKICVFFYQKKKKKTQRQ